jgi:hypothetical protein
MKILWGSFKIVTARKTFVRKTKQLLNLFKSDLNHYAALTSDTLWFNL